MSKKSKGKREVKKKIEKKEKNLKTEEKIKENKSARKIKYAEIINATVLKSALDKVFDGFYGADATFDLASLKREIKKYQDEFIEIRTAIIKQFGKQTAEGLDEYKVEEKNLIKFRQEMAKIEQKEIEIKSKKVKIQKRNIGLYSNQISVNDLVALEPFIEFTDNRKEGKR